MTMRIQMKNRDQMIEYKYWENIKKYWKARMKKV